MYSYMVISRSSFNFLRNSYQKSQSRYCDHLLTSTFSIFNINFDNRNFNNSIKSFSTSSISSVSETQVLRQVDLSNMISTTNNCSVRPEGVEHNWNLRIFTPSDIEAQTNTIKCNARAFYDQVATTSELSFEKVLKPILSAQKLMTVGWWYGKSASLPNFVRYVSDSAELRDASVEATKKLKKFCLEMDMRKDTFEKLVSYKEQQSEKENLSPEQRRNLDWLIQDGRRNGLHLNQEMRDKVTAIKTEIQELSIDFAKNISEDKTVVLWTKEELNGMSENYFESLEVDTETGKYKVSLSYPHYLPLMKKCRVPETRKRMEKEFNSRGGIENKNLLQRITKLRQDDATCLGYKSHAAYVQELLMARNPETVIDFLKSLAEKLQPLWKAEKEVMLNMKKEECEKAGRVYDGKLHMWETGYYLERVEAEMYAVDNEAIRLYFPIDVVTNGLLDIYQDLLGLNFNKVDDAEKWHEDVLVYEVLERKTDKLLGYFYMDLFPREGKHTHACCVTMQSGCPDDMGVEHINMATMICNFTKPTSTTPALLDKDEVQTYFHEFGHVMHVLCSKTETVQFFGISVEKDFVEAPSQMLENWVWEKEPLVRMSSHHQTKKPLPDDLIENLRMSRNANTGYSNLRQIVFALFDQRIHQTGECDVEKVYTETLREVMGLEVSEGTCFPASFGHLCSGYSGRYYSYLWSEVFSMDMFKSVFQKEGIMSPEAGMSYRTNILEKGGSMDAAQMLRNFLEREPNLVAFLESKGLSVV